MCTPSAVQGHLLEVTVVGCNKLKDTEWISRQDPYVCLEYASQKFRTKTCTDGHKNPAFQEKFVLSLIEGLREINVVVWNSNTLTYDDFIGSGKIQLHKVLSQGYDDTPWPLQSKSGRYAGEVRLIMHYANAKKPLISTAPSAPLYPASAALQVPGYGAPPPSAASMYPPVAAYPAASPSYPPPPNPTAYPPPPPNPTAYPPSAYPPQPTTYPQAYPPTTYPPTTYPPTTYPPTTYPPQGYPPQTYPPPPQATPYYHPPGIYPPTY